MANPARMKAAPIKFLATESRKFSLGWAEAERRGLLVSERKYVLGSRIISQGMRNKLRRKNTTDKEAMVQMKGLSGSSQVRGMKDFLKENDFCGQWC